MPEDETFLPQVMGFFEKKGIFVTEKCKCAVESPLFHTGEMLEWLKRHAWKACDRQNWFASSNLALSAKLKKEETIITFNN